MNLNELIAADNLAILEDDTTGRADTILFTPGGGGPVQTLKGLYNAMGVKLDPGTGLPVPGSSVEVTVAISSLSAMPDDGWRVEVQRDGATLATGYVDGEGLVDRTIGRVTFALRGVTYA